jgi:hypothetical protein
MTMEDRIRYLLRAASRAEGEGDRKVADALRRMAQEARPAGLLPGPLTRTGFGGYPD